MSSDLRFLARLSFNAGNEIFESTLRKQEFSALREYIQVLNNALSDRRRFNGFPYKLVWKALVEYEPENEKRIGNEEELALELTLLNMELKDILRTGSTSHKFKQYYISNILGEISFQFGVGYSFSMPEPDSKALEEI